MRKIVFLMVLLASFACMKKQADGTYKVDTAAAKSDTKKSGDDLKTDLQKMGEKLKADAQKVRDSETAKRVQEKAGEGLEKAGEKLKHAGEKTKEKARQ